MKKALHNQIITLLLGLVILLFGNSCAAPLQTTSAPAQTTGAFILFLQPLPQEAHRLTFRIAELAALQTDGGEIHLPLRSNTLSDDQIRVQQKLAQQTLPPGHYSGIALQITSASLKGEDGQIDLLAPQDRLFIEFPFAIRNRQAETLFLSLSADRLVTDGAIFTPNFTLWKPDRILTNLKGFVSNSVSDNMTIFNKRTAQVVGNLNVGKKPADMALDQLRNWLYIALSGENAIAVVEVNNGSILGRIPLRFGDEPMQLSLTQDGRTLLCLNRGSESVSIIDTASLFETSRIRLLSEPSGIFLGRGETQAYITHAASSRLSIIDQQSQTLRTTVSLEESPRDGVSSSNGRSLYLINDFSADLTVLDAASLKTKERIFIGTGATVIKADATSGLLYIGKQDGEITVVDPRSLMAIDSYALAGPVTDLTIDNEENALFAVLPKSNSLVKIDLVSKRMLGRVELESGSRAVVVMGER